MGPHDMGHIISNIDIFVPAECRQRFGTKQANQLKRMLSLKVCAGIYKKASSQCV